MTCLGENTVRGVKKVLWYLCHRCVLQMMSEKINEERDRKENEVLKRSPKQILKSLVLSACSLLGSDVLQNTRVALLTGAAFLHLSVLWIHVS